MAFYPLVRLNQLHDGYHQVFKVAGQELLLVQQDGAPVLMENRCPHMDAPLTHSTLLPNGRIRCRAHGIEFELSSGQACGPLAGTLCGLKKFTIAYDGDKLGVEL